MDAQNISEPSRTSADDVLAVSQYLTPRWIAGEIMLLLITIATVYIFVALMYYSWRFRHMARVGGCGHERRERYLHYSCAAVIFIAITRCILHQVISFSPRDPSYDIDLCRTMMIVSRVVYNLAICLTYVHLWLRQHMFYTKSDLKHLRTRALKILDWVVLVTIICTSAVLAIIAFVPLEGRDAIRTYHVDLCNAFEYNSKLSLYLYAGLSLLYQLILVALFLYPIIAQRLKQRKEKVPTSSTTTTGYPTIWNGIRRGFLLTVVVIVTDAAFGILVWILTKKYPGMLSSIIALNDVNLLINVICCICTFRNWRKIVFGFPVCRRRGWHHDSFLRSTTRTSLKISGEDNDVNQGSEAEANTECVDEEKMLKKTFDL